MLQAAVAAAGGMPKYCLHVLKIVILGIGPNAWDTTTDVKTTMYYLQNKTVERIFQNFTFAPSHCTVHENYSTLWRCQEMDPVWGTASAVFIQLPGFVLGFSVLVGVLLQYSRIGLSSKVQFCIVPFFALIPFPALVLIQQLISLVLITPQMEVLSSILLFGEGSLEAAPQLLLGLYIMLKDRHRINTAIQYVSAASSFFSISKTSIEMYSAESFHASTDVEDIMKHTDTYHDSIMDKKSFLQKLWILVQLSPAFITSLVFRVGSLAIITVLLHHDAILYMAIGCFITWIAAYSKFDADGPHENRAGAAIFYAISNITIVSKCPMGNRSTNYGPMMSTSLVWTTLHSVALISLMIWVGLGPNYYLTGWSETAIIASVPIFMSVCSGLLIMGPLAIIALWGLEKQVKAMGEKEKRDLWDPEDEY